MLATHIPKGIANILNILPDKADVCLMPLIKKNILQVMNIASTKRHIIVFIFVLFNDFLWNNIQMIQKTIPPDMNRIALLFNVSKVKLIYLIIGKPSPIRITYILRIMK